MYPYTDVNCFDQPNTYMYTTFYGAEFLQVYFENRMNSISYLKKIIDKNSLSIGRVVDTNETHDHLLDIKEHLDQNKLILASGNLELYIRRFEVAKRLRNYYPVNDKTDLAPIQTHILFYNIIINAYLLNNDVRYLNVMLKIGDTLTSIKESLNSRDDVNQLILLLDMEVKVLNKFMINMAVQL